MFVPMKARRKRAVARRAAPYIALAATKLLDNHPTPGMTKEILFSRGLAAGCLAIERLPQSVSEALPNSPLVVIAATVGTAAMSAHLGHPIPPKASLKDRAQVIEDGYLRRLMVKTNQLLTVYKDSEVTVEGAFREGSRKAAAAVAQLPAEVVEVLSDASLSAIGLSVGWLAIFDAIDEDLGRRFRVDPWQYRPRGQAGG